MPGPYSKEFRREAVALLRSSGKTPPQLGAELGVSPQTLRNWARQDQVDLGAAEGLTSVEREELRRLRRELRSQAEMARSIRRTKSYSPWLRFRFTAQRDRRMVPLDGSWTLGVLSL